MNVFFLILLYGIPASLLLSAIVVGMGLVNPRLMLRSYPKDVQAAVPPQTDQERRQTLYWGIPFQTFIRSVLNNRSVGYCNANAHCSGKATALRCKGDMTAVESYPDCTGNTKVTTKVTTRTVCHVVAYRESYKVFGGVLYSGSEW